MKAVLVAALTGCVLAPLAQAQESVSLYPSRPVTFVVPFTPGGSTSLIARSLFASRSRNQTSRSVPNSVTDHFPTK